jgi:hypothetical protein
MNNYGGEMIILIREYASRMAHPEQTASGGALNMRDCLFT